MKSTSPRGFVAEHQFPVSAVQISNDQWRDVCSVANVVEDALQHVRFRLGADAGSNQRLGSLAVAGRLMQNAWYGAPVWSVLVGDVSSSEMFNTAIFRVNMPARGYQQVTPANLDRINLNRDARLLTSERLS